jgi:hypothetical protein
MRVIVGLGSRSRPPAGRAGRTSLPTLVIGPELSDVVDLDPVAAVLAVEQEELRILRHRPPGVDVFLGDPLSAAGTLVAQLEPLVARDVLSAHVAGQRRSGGGGGAQPGFGPVGGASVPAVESAATIAARVSSDLVDGSISG